MNIDRKVCIETLRRVQILDFGTVLGKVLKYSGFQPELVSNHPSSPRKPVEHGYQVEFRISFQDRLAIMLGEDNATDM